MPGPIRHDETVDGSTPSFAATTFGPVSLIQILKAS